VFFYELEDSRDPRFAKYGLLRVSGKRKPAYRVLRDFVAAYAPPPGEGDPPAAPPGPGEGRPRTPLPD
jgi:hypothetical protein